MKYDVELDVNGLSTREWDAWCKAPPVDGIEHDTAQWDGYEHWAVEAPSIALARERVESVIAGRAVEIVRIRPLLAFVDRQAIESLAAQAATGDAPLSALCQTALPHADALDRYTRDAAFDSGSDYRTVARALPDGPRDKISALGVSPAALEAWLNCAEAIWTAAGFED